MSLRALPLLLLLCLSGCLGSGAGVVDEAAGEDAPVERSLLVQVEESVLVALGTPAACVVGEPPRYELERRSVGSVDGHPAIHIHARVEGVAVPLQFGHAVDDGDVRWSASFTQGDYEWTLAVAPDQWEADEPRWTFWMRYAPTDDADACNTGAREGSVTFEAAAVPVA